MTDLDVLLAIAGFIATLLVVAGMILVTPRGAIETTDDATDPQGEELSRADAIDPTLQSRSPHADGRPAGARGP
jgi:hypothetical protein